MKTAVILVSLFALILISCSKKEETKLTAFSTEAFAYGMGDSSEVDATTQVKGFMQKKENGNYKATLSFYVDLVTPKGDTVKSLFHKIADRIKKEKMSDTELNAQFDLDSTYAKGSYKLIFRIKDSLSNQTAITSAGFMLGE